MLKLLEDVGFTAKEAAVYLALLELGKGDVSDIAKISELKRPIIYVLLEGLIKRGYVSELPNKKINTYQAVDPSVILNQLKITTKNFAEMLPVMRTLHNKGQKRPKISYIENKEGIWKVYEDMNFEDENPFFITSYARIDRYFPGATANWVKNYRKGVYKLKGRHLVPNNPTEIAVAKKFAEVNQKVKVFKDLKDLEMDFSITGNKLAITSFEEEPFLVVIESQALVDAIKPIFEIAWAAGKEIVH